VQINIKKSTRGVTHAEFNQHKSKNTYPSVCVRVNDCSLSRISRRRDLNRNAWSKKELLEAESAFCEIKNGLIAIAINNGTCNSSAYLAACSFFYYFLSRPLVSFAGHHVAKMKSCTLFVDCCVRFYLSRFDVYD